MTSNTTIYSELARLERERDEARAERDEYRMLLGRLQDVVRRLPERWSGVAMPTQKLTEDLQHVIDVEYKRGEKIADWRRDEDGA